MYLVMMLYLFSTCMQVGSGQAQPGSERKTKGALKRRGAQHPAVAKLRVDCEEYLGSYLMSRLRGETHMPEELREACAIRHQWLLARLAELRRCRCLPMLKVLGAYLM